MHPAEIQDDSDSSQSFEITNRISRGLQEEAEESESRHAESSLNNSHMNLLAELKKQISAQEIGAKSKKFKSQKALSKKLIQSMGSSNNMQFNDLLDAFKISNSSDYIGEPNQESKSSKGSEHTVKYVFADKVGYYKSSNSSEDVGYRLQLP